VILELWQQELYGSLLAQELQDGLRTYWCDRKKEEEEMPELLSNMDFKPAFFPTAISQTL
jgi:hypothetical protein